MEVEMAIDVIEPIKKEQIIKTDNEIANEMIFVHLKMLSVALPNEYQKVLSRILVSLPSTIKQLKYLNFYDYLSNVDIENNSMKNINEKNEFISLPGTFVQKWLSKENNIIISDLTGYLQLLVLAYCYKECQDKTICLTNANYMLGVVELYQPTITAPLRAKIIYYIFLIFEKFKEKCLDMQDFLFRHLRYSVSFGESACIAEVLNLICRQYVITCDFRQFRHFLSSKVAIDAIECFQDVTYYDPGKSNQLARFMFYRGYLNMISCRYNEAFDDLNNALRSAPIKTAEGFKSQTAKFIILVELIRKSSVRQEYYKYLRDGAIAYIYLFKAISYGNLDVFDEFVKTFQNVYQFDKVQNIIDRLFLNVKFQAIKIILNSYSSISVEQIAQKLNISVNEDAKNLVAMYIRKNNLKDTIIDSATNVIYNSSHLADYGTNDTFHLLHKRILQSAAYCDLCLKKMVYDTKDYYNKLAHDQEDNLYFDDDKEESKVFWNKNEDDTGPDAGI